MLSRRLDRVAAFTRRDAVRLFVAAALLITGLTAVLAMDDLPSAVDLQVGDVAPVDVAAPRTIVFTSEIETEEARQAARDAVPPQYNYRAETAATLTSRQLSVLAETLAPVDAAFDPAVTPEERAAVLAEQPPDLTPASRATLQALAPSAGPSSAPRPPGSSASSSGPSSATRSWRRSGATSASASRPP